VSEPSIAIPWLKGPTEFPAVETALASPNGLLAAGGELTPARLVAAYSRGIFPWYSEGQPVLWWSPDPRMVLFPDELKISRSLGKTLRRGVFQIRADTVFPLVMRACAAIRRPGQSGTWITEEILEGYRGLYELGLAHSIEAWQGDELVGGLYGVALGRAFFGESMFALQPDASKSALVHLVRQLRRWRFEMIDCQQNTAHLASFGAREIARADFTARISELLHYPHRKGPWKLDDDLHE
jgi:leucyl/phenylalanyl-tRNA---protein transferase